jgi:hypothetical protein
LVVAQADALAGSSGLLLFLLGGGLIGALISAYRFYVNFRTTERGMARQRIQQATRNERAAQYEAGLWQARCADLEYLMRREGLSIPPLPDELKALVAPEALDVVDWNITPNPGAGGQQP